MNYTAELNNHTLEFFEASHQYVADGVMVPSITQMLAFRFPNKYAGISKETLERAAEKGTRVHEAIERLVTTGEAEDIPEVRGFEFLRKWYGFDVSATERPVILYHEGEPIAAGRFDLQLEWNNETGGADIKRTASLDKEYLSMQLNLYRIAVRQTYGTEWKFLRGLHLRDDTRRFVPVQINEGLTLRFIEDYRRTHE